MSKSSGGLLTVELVHAGGRWVELVHRHLSSRVRGGVIASHRLPERLPLMLDDPAEYMPAGLGAADVVFAIHLHPELLLEIPYAVRGKTTRALIAPIEDPTWIRPGLQRQVAAACEKLGLESAFPKPCCSLEPVSPVIRQFSELYGVGRPRFRLRVENQVIAEAECWRGSPCGTTHFVAHGLVGKRVEEASDAAKTLHHSYPCLASMVIDPDQGDTLMHQSFNMVVEGVEQALKEAGA